MGDKAGGKKDLFTALSKQQPIVKSRPIDPERIFESLRIRTGSQIKELWRPQADALREWNGARHEPDVMIQLKTGAGKTLIGLVAAQSLVNETRGKVIYCCATNQLIEQTQEKAEELGIPVATYMSQTWENQAIFSAAEGPLLTNYAALFNGRSIFEKMDLTAVIFDDAHTAHDSIRSAFTLTIQRSKYPDLYQQLIEPFADYFESVGRDYALGMITGQRDGAGILMVPLFESAAQTPKLRRALLEHGVESVTEFKFPWAHIGHHLSQCVMLFDAQTVQFTPLLPPVHKLRAFRKNVRRLYLSATLRVNDEFIRTFGRAPTPIIRPGGRAGDSQRLFLLPSLGMIDEAQRTWADSATERLKAVIMVPSSNQASVWNQAHDVEVFDTTQGNARIREFADSTDDRLVFVARYDGVDLPDEACRVMIVDGLPSGMSLLDRFFESHLERAGISDAKIASRFVQLLGRTSRGMSDYGAVLLIGTRLLDWVLSPGHRALLPTSIQRQLSVGGRLSKLEGFATRYLLDECLNQTQGWETAYERGMSEATVEPRRSKEDAKRAKALATAERKAAEALWDEDPVEAVHLLGAIKTDAFEEERALGAWLLHWMALATQMAGDGTKAANLYREAARAKRDLGAMPQALEIANATNAEAHSEQARRLASLLETRGMKQIAKDLVKCDSDLRDSAASAGVHEEALRVLGKYLGYESRRPDKETKGKGPDNVWVRFDKTEAVIFDAKTRKVNNSYDKDIIGRCVQHSMWTQAEYEKASLRHFLVGPRAPATPQSTVPPGLRVIAPEQLAGVAKQLLAVYAHADKRNLPLFNAAELQEGLDETGFGWDVLFSSLETVRLDSL